MIYLDYAATTPTDPDVAAAMAKCLTVDGVFANAASDHALGRQAGELVEQARAEVAALLNADPREITFTSGATEANNLALFGAARFHANRGRHIVSSRIEHKAVLDPCRALANEGFDLTLIEPDGQGRIDADAVSAALRDDTTLVSVMLVNNELGTINDVAAIAACVREHGALLHVDAAQAVGKLPIDLQAWPVDLLSLSAHKLYGPKGIGALFMRREPRARLQPVLYGGGQEAGLRAGTLPTHQVVGLGVASRLAGSRMASDAAHLHQLNQRFFEGLESLAGIHVNANEAERVPGIVNLRFAGVFGDALRTALRELQVASGSACNSATQEPSYVLRALGLGDREAEASIRFSFGRQTTLDEIDHATALIGEQVLRLRDLAP